MAFTKLRARVRVSGEVCKPVMISTPFCTGTGFMKCVLRTRCSAPFAAAAILVMLILEVFVARIAFEGAISASSENIFVFSEGISYLMLIKVTHVG